MRDHLLFIKEFLTRFEQTGSAVPSSKWAARALINPLRKTQEPQNILEVGSGTGAITTSIIQDMIPGDHLTLCELNPKFMQILKKKLASDSDYIQRKENIDFFLGPVQNIPEDKKFDLIVCALPFNNMKVEVIAEIFAKLERISTKKTHITFFEYMGLRRIGQLTSAKERRERLKLVENFFTNLNSKYESRTERVWLNFTPINVYTLKLRLAA